MNKRRRFKAKRLRRQRKLRMALNANHFWLRYGRVLEEWEVENEWARFQKFMHKFEAR